MNGENVIEEGTNNPPAPVKRYFSNKHNNTEIDKGGSFSISMFNKDILIEMKNRLTVSLIILT